MVSPEWTFVDAATGEEAAAGYDSSADKAAGAISTFYGYIEAIDSTLLHWVDLTRLNPFIETARFLTHPHSDQCRPHRRQHSDHPDDQASADRRAGRGRGDQTLAADLRRIT